MAKKGKKPRWADEGMMCQQPRAVACETCLFRPTEYEGKWLDRADTDTCAIYKDPERKPRDIYFDGADCDDYQPASKKPLGLLMGLAVGDALGVPVEFKARGSFTVRGMQGHGTHNQPPGTWSDDTSMALALADSLFTDGVCLDTLALRFKSWLYEGEYTPWGEVFDVGNATAAAIRRLRLGVPPEQAGGDGERDNGNGALMRIAPLVFCFFGEGQRSRFQLVKSVASLTHRHEWSVASCFIYMEYLNLLRKNRDKDAAYDELKYLCQGELDFISAATLQKFSRILQGDIRSIAEQEIRSSGFVIDTLEASLWSFLTTDSYEGAVLKAVNLGDDTDTTGAVTGALAGLYYGVQGIPSAWLGTLAKRDMVRRIAEAIPHYNFFKPHE